MVDVGQLDFAPNIDVRPTTTKPVIVMRDGKRVVDLMRWGLVPFWARDPKAITNCLDARSENAYQKPMFRGPFKNKRCLVPASAFYEWTHLPGAPRQVKYRISRSAGDLVALAGLWGYWHREDQEILSYTILTTGPNEMMAELHDRMPVIVGEEERDEWLAAESCVDSLRAMRMPSSEWLTAVPTP